MTWQYIGHKPNLFHALRSIGLLDPHDPSVSEKILMRIDNARADHALSYTWPGGS